jgi:hypothetical protein
MKSENKKATRTLADIAYHFYGTTKLVEEHEPKAAFYVKCMPTIYKFVIPSLPSVITAPVEQMFPISRFLQKHEYLATQIFNQQEIDLIKQRQQKDHQEREMYAQFKDQYSAFEEYLKNKK